MCGHKLNQKICTLFVRGGIAAVECSSMWADTMGGEYYKGGWK